jgi:hypothetical protein
MNTKKITAAALVPAAAGIALSGWAVFHHATSQVTSGHVTATHAVHGEALLARPHQARTAPRRDSQKSATAARTAAAAKIHPNHGALDQASHPGHPAASQPKPAKATATPASRPATTSQPAASEPAASQPAAPSTSSLQTGMSSFEQCVAWHESGDNPTASSSGLFGILPATWASLGYPGTAGAASVGLQEAAFNRLYAEYGTQPWAAYDGC